MDDYDVIVIGTGTAAQVTAARVKRAGRSVAMIDHRPLRRLWPSDSQTSGPGIGGDSGPGCGPQIYLCCGRCHVVEIMPRRRLRATPAWLMP
jgi:choline dehydrogenase-like flavoprotein